ncbi:hypothetical protein M0812_02218 [Anaeramoeba flamelloides]|uniref:Uncharacterized protein n=1 Tax=Anaeramoeba flamelloides TaxID=1746091 RepID=A0AAV7YZB4_9EUKA|nr:hypothetical protein M0812_02218 [Anaeramoeba flamelloides]
MRLTRITPKNKNSLFQIDNTEFFEEQFHKQFNFSNEILLDHAAKNIIQELKISLKHLDFYPVLAKMTPIFDDITAIALKPFLNKYNLNNDDKTNNEQEKERGEEKEKENENEKSNFAGKLLNIETLFIIREKLKEYCEMFLVIGFEIQGDIIKNPKLFSTTVKRFQASTNIFQDGRFFQNTITKLNELYKLKSPQKK